MWHYRDMQIKMIAPHCYVFQNITEASHKLDTPKFLIHQSISNNIPLYGIITLVYIYKKVINTNKEIHVEERGNNNQRGISGDITGKKRPRGETYDQGDNL